MMVGAFDTDPSCTNTTTLSNIFNVDNVPEDTWNQMKSTKAFNINPGNHGSPNIFFSFQIITVFKSVHPFPLKSFLATLLF
jgi:hypothetical protein